MGRAVRGMGIVVGLALLSSCGKDKRTITYTICNHTEGAICVIAGDTVDTIAKSDCIEFSKTTDKSCVDLSFAVRDESLAGCGASKGSRCVTNGETWNVD